MPRTPRKKQETFLSQSKEEFSVPQPLSKPRTPRRAHAHTSTPIPTQKTLHSEITFADNEEGENQTEQPIRYMLRNSPMKPQSLQLLSVEKPQHAVLTGTELTSATKHTKHSRLQINNTPSTGRQRRKLMFRDSPSTPPQSSIITRSHSRLSANGNGNGSENENVLSLTHSKMKTIPRTPASMSVNKNTKRNNVTSVENALKQTRKSLTFDEDENENGLVSSERFDSFVSPEIADTVLTSRIEAVSGKEKGKGKGKGRDGENENEKEKEKADTLKRIADSTRVRVIAKPKTIAVSQGKELLPQNKPIVKGNDPMLSQTTKEKKAETVQSKMKAYSDILKNRNTTTRSMTLKKAIEPQQQSEPMFHQIQSQLKMQTRLREGVQKTSNPNTNALLNAKFSQLQMKAPKKTLTLSNETANVKLPSKRGRPRKIPVYDEHISRDHKFYVPRGSRSSVARWNRGTQTDLNSDAVTSSLMGLIKSVQKKPPTPIVSSSATKRTKGWTRRSSEKVDITVPLSEMKSAENKKVNVSKNDKDLTNSDTDTEREKESVVGPKQRLSTLRASVRAKQTQPTSNPDDGTPQEVPKRKRGRPKKNPVTVPDSSDTETEPIIKPKNKRTKRRR